MIFGCRCSTVSVPLPSSSRMPNNTMFTIYLWVKNLSKMHFTFLLACKLLLGKKNTQLLFIYGTLGMDKFLNIIFQLRAVLEIVNEVIVLCVHYVKRIIKCECVCYRNQIGPKPSFIQYCGCLACGSILR